MASKKKKRKKARKGQVPLHILENRLHKLASVVARRGGHARPKAKRRKSSTRKK